MCPTVRAQNANSALRHIRLSPAFVGCQSRATWDGDMYEQRTGSAPPCVIWVLWGPKKQNDDQRKCQDAQSGGMCPLLPSRAVPAIALFCLGRWGREKERALSDWLKLIPFLSLPIKHANKKKMSVPYLENSITRSLLTNYNSCSSHQLLFIFLTHNHVWLPNLSNSYLLAEGR